MKIENENAQTSKRCKADSNPGSLDCESGILPLSYRAPLCETTDNRIVEWTDCNGQSEGCHAKAENRSGHNRAGKLPLGYNSSQWNTQSKWRTTNGGWWPLLFLFSGAVARVEICEADAGFAITSHLISNLASQPKSHDDSLMVMQIQLTINQKAILISAYAPTLMIPGPVLWETRKLVPDVNCSHPFHFFQQHWIPMPPLESDFLQFK